MIFLQDFWRIAEFADFAEMSSLDRESNVSFNFHFSRQLKFLPFRLDV